MCSKPPFRTGARSSLARLASAPIRRFIGVPIAAGDRSNAAPDVVVNVVRQVCQGHAERPLGGVEAASVQQYDAMGFGQLESEIERVDVLLEVFDGGIADVLARPELEIDQSVVGVVVGIRIQLVGEAQAV